MAQATHNSVLVDQLSQPIDDTSALSQKLDELRSRIRRYVWLQGISLAIAVFVFAFWLATGLDYLPVSLGLSEMPWQPRLVVLALISGAVAFVIWFWILRRAFVRLPDRSLALLMERKFDEFNDALATSVEFASSRFATATEIPHLAESKDADLQMLAHTTQQADRQIKQVHVARVLNPRPLKVAMTLAGVAILSVVAFATINLNSFTLASNRILLLKDDPWPRGSHIEVVGIRVKRDHAAIGSSESQEIIPFVNNLVRVSKGSHIELIARADADTDSNPDRTVPRYCTMQYQNDSGDWGRRDLNKVGRPEAGFQTYTLNQQPLNGMLSTTRFYLRGGDHRIGRFTIEVVDAPSIVESQLDCQFPEYMVDPTSGAWTQRTIRNNPGTQLPIGTKVTMRFNCNKPISSALIRDLKTDRLRKIVVNDNAPINGRGNAVETSDPTLNQEADREFKLELPPITSDIKLAVMLLDRDGVWSDLPQIIDIPAIEDKAPRVNVRIAGIGSAITPNAIVPFTGSIVDEYAVARSWIEFKTTDGDPQRLPVELPSDGTVDTSIDFEQLAANLNNPFKLLAGPQQTVTVSINAEDFFDLDGPANIGSGDKYVLNVVTPGQMSRILERLEVGQRRRLEQIYEEMNDANEYLLRAVSGTNPAESENSNSESNASEPGDSDAKKPDDEAESIGVDELNLLYAQRALLQARKSSQEILGISETFFNIRDQLVNNRLDRKDKKSRLEDEIALPLQKIGEESMVELELRISTLEARLKKAGTEYNEDTQVGINAAGDAAIEQTAIVIRQIDDVLRILIKYESYSELLEVVRKMRDDQKKLLEETKKKRRSEQIGDLLK